ncbi:DUF1800 domain-containing protein [Gangjinia marincola]|uniref:DUF1800 domain-containing protein n=1 Tax=Gangjinia marincola TaxID=578463 RepID=A0ABN1MFP3_9FLAO
MRGFISTLINDIDPYLPSDQNPWNENKIQHLFRRTSFGIPSQDILDYLDQNPSDIVDLLVDEAIALPPSGTPFWAEWTWDQFIDNDEEPFTLQYEWMNSSVYYFLENKLREKMTLFWSNHFVTQFSSVDTPPYLVKYVELLQIHAVGNFKDFTRAIGLNNSMLIYLNGYENVAGSPNENYARELFELFTLGENNGYTQADIVEASRAFTGYNQRDEGWGPIIFNPDTFDGTEKTIFGQTGNWGYDDVIDILFAERADEIADFICNKLYRFFISPQVNTNVVNGLAQTFKDNDFEIAPVLRQLLKSEDFFAQENCGVLIKSPLDLLITLHRESSLSVPNDYDIASSIRNHARFTGQELYNPIDVAGWQMDQSWISSSLLVGRWEYSERLINKYWQFEQEQLRNWAIQIAGDGNDPFLITERIVNHLLAKPLLAYSEYEAATDIFKANVPQNYFDDGSWNMNWDTVPNQTRLLLKYILRIPEFQLQ